VFGVAPLIAATKIGFKLGVEKAFGRNAIPYVIFVQEFVLFGPSF
jgi:hypothetical protein